jgi:hypothetical protein
MPIGIQYQDRYEQFGHLSKEVLAALVNNDATPQEYKDFAKELLAGGKTPEPVEIEEQVAAELKVDNVNVIAEESVAGVHIEEQPELDKIPIPSVLAPDVPEKVQILDEPTPEHLDALSVPSTIPDAAAPPDPVCSGDSAHCEKCAGVEVCLETKN